MRTGRLPPACARSPRHARAERVGPRTRRSISAPAPAMHRPRWPAIAPGCGRRSGSSTNRAGSNRCTARTSCAPHATTRHRGRTPVSESPARRRARCSPRTVCPWCSATASGTRVGIAHAGWRGLANGVIARCVEFMDRPGRELLAWLGPAIGQDSYEVGRGSSRRVPCRRPRRPGRVRPVTGADGPLAGGSVRDRGVPARIAGSRARPRRRILHLS